MLDKVKTGFSNLKDKVRKSSKKIYMSAITMALACAVLIVPASAEGEESVTALVDVAGITSLLGSIWTFMTTNPLLSFFVAISVISGICSVFRKLRKTAH